MRMQLSLQRQIVVNRFTTCLHVAALLLATLFGCSFGTVGSSESGMMLGCIGVTCSLSA